MTFEIEELIKNIDKNPDKLHSDYTPSVHQLIDIGKPAISHLLKLMLSTPPLTRQRAQRALEGITMKMYGFKAGQGWATQNGERDWLKFWASLGDLSHDAPLELRSAAVKRWSEWL